MRHLNVLVITPKITELKILNWKVSKVETIEAAIEAILQNPFKVIAISKDCVKSDILKIHKIASLLSDTIPVVEFKDTTDFSKHVNSAYWSIHKPGYAKRYLDNSFEIKLAQHLQTT